MRIKIIGDNNCARATRHLLRMAGFAVTEFLPAEAITQAPHRGYAITIETSLRTPHDGGIRSGLSPAQLTPDASRKTLEANPASAPENRATAVGPSSSPDLPTHGQPASTDEGASTLAKAGADASSPSSSGTGLPVRQAGFSLSGVGEGVGGGGKEKGRQAEACPTGGGSASDVSTSGTLGSSIHFDSVDGALEAAVLRHVAQLAGAAVIVDRPGGVVHSERELRIILPATGNVKADEAAAATVEFGVLRGMLDLVTPPAANVTDKSAAGSGDAPSGSKKNLWTMFRAAARAARHRSGVVLIAGALLGGALVTAAGNLHASPRPASPRPGSPALRVVEARGVDGAYLRLEAALAPAPAQGQFAAGQLNIALIGGAAVSSSLYDSGNTALKVNCVVGCGAASTFSDNAAFSAGSTAVNNLSAVFNDSIAALTSGNAGAVRSTSDRMLYVNVGKLGGTALSGANVVDSGNTAFRVNYVVGCAAAGFTDNSAFTAGTTTEGNVGGVFNDGLSTLSSGNAAAARITASRAIHVNLRNASGTEIGTASNPMRVDPTGTTAQPVKITDGTNTVVVDPCKGQTKLFVSINQTANAQLASGTSSKKIYICSIHVVVAAATNVALVEGTGSVCATGTAGVSGFGGATAATGWNFAANGGIVLGNGDSSLGAEGTAADNLCVYNSGSGQVSGGVSYVVQ
jgi:hypothetical protein